MVLLSHIDTDFLIQSVSEGLARGFEIVPRLEVHPELRLHPKEAAQSQGSICRDSSLLMDNLVNATRRYPDRLSQMVLADLHGLQKILKQNLARMDRRKVALGHHLTSVIVNDFHIIRVTVRPRKKFIASRTLRMHRRFASLGLFLGYPSYRLINDWAIAWHGDEFTTRPRGL